MVAIWTLCAWIAWTPAWDSTLEQEVVLHFFYEDELPRIIAPLPEMEVCRIAYDVPVTYSVAGVVPDGEGLMRIGPQSNSLTVIWPIPEPTGGAMLCAGITLLAWLKRLRQP